MADAFYINGENSIGGRFSGPDRTPNILKKFINQNECGSSNTVFGLPADAFEFNSIFIPETNKKKVHEILSLQSEFHNGSDSGEERISSTITREEKSGTSVVHMTTKALEIPPKASLYPINLALYALANGQGMISPGTRVLIVCLTGTTTLTLCADGEEVVSMRQFVGGKDPTAQLGTSCQMVYFQKNCGLFTPDKIIVISDNEQDADRIKDVFPDTVSVSLFDMPEAFSGSAADPEENIRLLLVYGLSLIPQIKALSDWNIQKVQKDRWQHSRWYLVRIILLILAGIPAAFSTEIICNRILIDRIDKKSRSFAPLYKRVSADISQINYMKNFASHSGRNMISPDICYEVFQAIDSSRTSDIQLSSINGNLYKNINFSATAANYSSMLRFLDKLAKQKRIKSSQLVTANLASDGKVDFQCIVTYHFDREFKSASKKGDQDQ